MSNKMVDLGRYGLIAVLLQVVPYIVSPFLFIWAVNTLFGSGIPITFKTWLAVFTIIVLVRYHTRSFDKPQDPYDFYFDEDEGDDFFDEDEDEISPDPEEQRQKLRDNLIVYRSRSEKDTSPDGSQ